MTVSVVIPCYNVESYVGRAVASVLAQTVKPLEILCVDDGSTDGTLAVLRRLEAEHTPAVTVLTGPNQGACSARNRGLTEATSDYVQFLDADDVLDATKFERQLACAAGSDPDLVAGAYRRMRPDGSLKIFGLGSEGPWLDFLARKLGITTSNLWKRSAVVSAGGWNEAWPSSQEAELMFRMLRAGAHVVYDTVPRATLLDRPTSISHGFRPEARERYVRVRVEALRHLAKAEAIAPDAFRRAVDIVFGAIRMLYHYDPVAALAFYHAAIPGDHVPPVSSVNTRAYVLAYRLFGFARTEAIRATAGRLREALWRRADLQG